MSESHGVQVILVDDHDQTEAMAVAGFLAGYCGATRRSYATDLRLFAHWCRDTKLRLLFVRRAHLELFGRWMEETGRMRSTVARRLSTLASFYRYCEEEGIVEYNPAVNVRRPKLDYESRTLGLDRNELGAFLVQAGLGSARDHALASLLAVNGLRISEALGADIDDLDFERGHRTLKIVRKGGKHVVVPLAPRTSRALDLYIAERTTGPIFLGEKGSRMDRYAADRMVKRLARRAGIAKRISPHSLRHSFITAALDAGVPLRDVQEAASHADPRTTMRYDRGRQSLDRHATYIVATFVAASPGSRYRAPVALGPAGYFAGATAYGRGPTRSSSVAGPSATGMRGRRDEGCCRPPAGGQQRLSLPLLRDGIAWLRREVLGDAEVPDLYEALRAGTRRRRCARLEGDDEVLGDAEPPAHGHEAFRTPVVTARSASSWLLRSGEVHGHTESPAGSALKALGAVGCTP